MFQQSFLNFKPNICESSGNFKNIFRVLLTLDWSVFNDTNTQIRHRKNNKIKVLLYDNGVMEGGYSRFHTLNRNKRNIKATGKNPIVAPSAMYDYCTFLTSVSEIMLDAI
jgi:hypothetical protein